MVLHLLWEQVDVPGSLLPGTSREVIVRTMHSVRANMVEAYACVAGWGLGAYAEGGMSGLRRGRGVCEEQLWSIFSTPIPPSIALTIQTKNVGLASDANPISDCPCSAVSLRRRGRGSWFPNELGAEVHANVVCLGSVTRFFSLVEMFLDFCIPNFWAR